jgi:putative tryptophan/tyrosine transport system substrate-binding protein
MAVGIGRRQFVSALGGAATWPLAVRAQQAGRLPTIGILGGVATVWSSWTTALVTRLHELGWIEGRTIAIEYRWAEGKPERIAEYAAEFIRLKVDVIVTNDSAASIVKQAISAIPIVFVFGIDPVSSGLVASLARPGGNVTGLSQQSTDLASKKVELLIEMVPGLRRVTFVGNSAYRAAMLEGGEVQKASSKAGLETLTPEIRRGTDIAPVFEALKGPADAICIVIDAFMSAFRTRIITLALTQKLATIFNAPDHVEAGGLMSYGPAYADQLRRAADYVDKILRGAKPADLPVEQPTKFDFAVNLTTAKALGLTVPPNLLAIADEVIE